MPTFDGRSKTAAVTTATVVHILRPTESERDHTGRLTDIPTVAAAGHNAAWPPIGLEFQKSLLGSENFRLSKQSGFFTRPRTNSLQPAYKTITFMYPILNSLGVITEAYENTALI